MRRAAPVAPALAAALCFLCACFVSAQEPLAGAAGREDILCEFTCMLTPQAAALAVSAAEGGLDAWMSAREACDCELPPAPDSEAAVLSPLGEELEPALPTDFALRSAVVDEAPAGGSSGVPFFS